MAATPTAGAAGSTPSDSLTTVEMVQTALHSRLVESGEYERQVGRTGISISSFELTENI